MSNALEDVENRVRNISLAEQIHQRIKVKLKGLSPVDYRTKSLKSA